MATYFWVGGNGTWDATTTTNWATSVGGSGGAGVPTSTDNAAFNSLSNATAYAVTIGTNAVAADITIAGPAAGNVTITSAATSVINCYGSWTNTATGVAFTTTSGAAINFSATTTGKTVTTNNVTLGAMAVTFNNSSGGWTLGSAITTTGVFTVTSGTFDTGTNYAINAASFSSSGGTFKSITLNSSTLTFTATGGFQIATTATNLTFSGASSTIVCSNGSPTFGGISGLTYGTVQFTSVALLAVTITGANTYTNLTFTSRTTDGLGAIGFSGDQVVTGTLTVGTANTAVRRLWLRSSAIGTQRTFTVATIATLSDVDFRDIVAAGASGTWSGTRLGNCRNNSNITFGAGATKYWNLAAGGNWSAIAWATSSGGAPALNNFPLAQDTCIIENTGLTAGNTITIDANWNIGTLNLSGRTLAFNWTQGNLDPFFYGDVTLTTAMTMVTVTGSPSWTFCGQGAIQTLNSAGVIIRLNQLNVESPGWGLTLAVNTEVDLSPIALPFNNGAFILTAGTLDFANKNLSAPVFSIGAGANTLVFGSTGTLTSTVTVAAISFTGSTTTTVSGTPLVILNANTSATRTITPQSVTEANTISFRITTGTGALTLTGGNYRDLDFTDGTNPTGYAGAIGGTTTLNVYGNFKASTGMTQTPGASGLNFVATSGTKTITTAAVVFDRPISFNGVGGTWQLQDALTSGATRTLTLTNGTLDLNNNTVTTGIFSSSNSNVRSILFVNSSIVLTGLNSTIHNTSNSTNLTLTGSKSIQVTGVGLAAQTRTISSGATSSGGTEATTFNFVIASGADAIDLGTTSSVFGKIQFNPGFTGNIAANASPQIYDNLTLSSGMTVTGGTNAWVFKTNTLSAFTPTILSNNITINNPITFDAIGGTWQLSDNLTLGSTRTLTLTAGTFDFSNLTVTTGIFSSSNSNARTLAFGSFGRISITGSGTTVCNTNTATGLTVTGGQIKLIQLETIAVGTRIITGASDATAIEGTNLLDYYFVDGSDTVTFTANCAYNTINFYFFGSFTGTLTNNAISIYGNFSLSSSMTLTDGANAFTFKSTTSTLRQIETNGNTINNPVTFNGVGGNWYLSGNTTLGSTKTLTLTAGAIDLSNYTLTAGIFNSSGSLTRSIAFGATGKIVANYASGTATVVNFGTSTNFSYTGTSRIEVAGNPSTGTRTITGASPGTGTEANALNIYVTAGSDTVSLGTTNRYYGTIDFTGFTGTLVNTSDFTLFGDLVLVSGMTWAATSGSGLIFASTNATARSITTAGKTFNCPLNFNGIGGTWAFQDALTMASTKSLSLTNGTLQLQSGTTNVVGSFVTPGTNQVYLRATTFGTQATISAASGINTATNISLQDSNATGGAVWRASNALGTVDAGNNSGWFYLGWYVIPNNQSPMWANVIQA